MSETLGFPLSLIQREVRAGMFSADILADTEGERLVVIENQLESTDHDHLGKLITYISNLDAKVAVWITSAPRAEHERAVHWLNEVLPGDMAFYLIKVEAFRIGDSAAAPLFTVVAGPSKAAQEAGEAKKELAKRHVLRQEFWTELLARAKEKTPLHARISPSTDSWVGTTAGRGGLSYNYLILFDGARVELYMNSGDASQNKRVFDALMAHKDPIEQAFGASLNWQRLDNRKACRISYVILGGGLLDREHWPEIQDRMIAAMVRLEQAFKPYIQSLPTA